MAIMKSVHMAWNGSIIGTRAKPGNQLVLIYNYVNNLTV